MTIRVVLADDHVLMRQGVSQMLTANPDISVVGECDDGVALIAAVLKLSPDVILMDIHMPEMDGVQATRKIMTEHPTRPVCPLERNSFKALGFWATQSVILGQRRVKHREVRIEKLQC